MLPQIMKKQKSSIFVVLAAVILVSCDTRTLATSIKPTLSSTIAISSSSSDTPSPTTTASSTLTPEPTVTSTFVSTLLPQLGDTELRQILQNDNECKLPCFLGIVPEKTTFAEFQNIFFHFGLPVKDYEGKGTAYFVSHYPDREVPPEANYFVQDNLVKSIKIYIDQSNQFEWSIYSPSALLKRYGVPSRVSFDISVIHEPIPTPWKGWYGMTIYYSDIDFIIEYDGAEVRLGKQITVCPNKDEFEGARAWLGKNPNHPPFVNALLEQATSLTLEKFTDFLLQGPGACFQLNADKIPTG